MVYAMVSKTISRKAVRVRLPPSAPLDSQALATEKGLPKAGKGLREK